MGGLRKKIPWTFWTMFMATLASPASRFSASSVRTKSFLQRSAPARRLWALGVLTGRAHLVLHVSLLFLTFFGAQRFDENMFKCMNRREHVAPLVVLAILAVGGGWMAARASLGGANLFEQYLAPVFSTAPETPAAAREASWRDRIAAGSPGSASDRRPDRFFLRLVVLYPQPQNAEQLAARSLRPTNCQRKYFVANCTPPQLSGPRLDSDKVLWRVVDEGVIDGTVNASHTSPGRPVTAALRGYGNIRTYALDPW